MAVWGYAKTGSGIPWLEQRGQAVFFTCDCPEVSSRSVSRGQYAWVFRRALAIFRMVVHDDLHGPWVRSRFLSHCISGCLVPPRCTC